jgi:hypothetical protein
MKATYSVPKLTVHGNVADITQVVGSESSRKDFVFLNGEVISNRNDLDSQDLDCTGSLPNINCTAKPN